MILQLDAIDSRSPFANVRVLLSSRTEFKFSIQMLSTGPSKTNQTCSSELEMIILFYCLNAGIEECLLGFIFKVFLHKAENIPSVQSFVATSNLPNICAAVIAFGFILISLKVLNKFRMLLFLNRYVI